MTEELDLGLTSARGLFARRRMGKSEFLKHDLLPAALRAGYQAAYTNLWDDTECPVPMAGLLEADGSLWRRQYEFAILGPRLSAGGLAAMPKDIREIYQDADNLSLRWNDIYTLNK